jgi:hypothetical protein
VRRARGEHDQNEAEGLGRDRDPEDGRAPARETATEIARPPGQGRRQPEDDDRVEQRGQAPRPAFEPLGVDPGSEAGALSVASGALSVASGALSVASGALSVASGALSVASGASSIAVGAGSSTTASAAAS